MFNSLEYCTVEGIAVCVETLHKVMGISTHIKTSSAYAALGEMVLRLWNVPNIVMLNWVFGMGLVVHLEKRTCFI